MPATPSDDRDARRRAGGASASFGYLVRRHRLGLDLTQAALARRVGCSPATVKKIERDERRPSRAMAERLAASLELPAADHPAFVAAGVGEVAAVGLALPTAPVGATSPLPSWLADLAPTRPAFVGRDRELAILDGHLAAALDGGGRVVFVAGEAGQGKTALLGEFAVRAHGADPALLIARGQGSAAGGQADPYLPFRDVLLMLLADPLAPWQADQLVPGQAERLWRGAPTVAAAIASAGPQLLAGFLPLTVQARFGAPALGPQVVDVAPQEHLRSQIADVIDAIARDQPLLLLLDDLQWADAASAELLFHLSRRVTGSRVLVVGAYRPSEVAGATGSRAGSALRQTVNEVRAAVTGALIDLTEPDAAAARALCDALVDREPNDLTAAFRDHLFHQTGGHPLFVIELLRELRARGQLAQDADGRWAEAGTVDWAALPDRVSAVVEQRLARLGADERTLLEVAAVEGEHFTAEVAAAGAGLDDGTAARLLAREIDAVHGLARHVGAAGPAQQLTRYRFGHVLFRQYLYDRLGDGERRRLHGAVAAELERLHGEDLDPVIGPLAHHWTAAGDADRAVPYLLRAGDRARLVYANEEAVRHYDRAVTFLRRAGDRERLARTLMKLGLTHQTGFDHAQAQRAFDEAFALWGEVPTGVPAADGTPERTATLRLAWQDPPSLDPTMGGYNLTAPVITQLLSGLVTFGEDNEVLPDVAESWELEDGGRRYVFHLRPDVTWTDGAPVTAHDFAFTYQRALDPATGAPVAGSLLAAVTGAAQVRDGGAFDPADLGIRAVDDHTLVIELAEPVSYFIQNLAYYVLLPVPRHVVTAHGDAWARPEAFVGNGPFRLVRWEAGRELVLDRNPHYHGPASGNVARVHLDLGVGADEHADRYAADDLDVLSRWFAPLPEFDRARQRFPMDHVVRPTFVTHYYWIDPTFGPFQAPRVRRALALAIDRPRLAEVALRGYVTAATGGFVPPGMPGHVPGIALPFDPETARALIADAGVGDLELTVLGRDAGVARFVAAAWSEVGLRARGGAIGVGDRPEPVGSTVLVGGWWADYPDPDNFLRVDVELDLPAWPHEHYWEVIRRADASEDQAERLRWYAEAERILADEAVLVPLYYQPMHYLLKPWITRWPTAAVKYPGFWKDVEVGARGGAA